MGKLEAEHFFIVIFISLHISEVSSNVCYACRDTSSAKDKNDCQVNTLAMQKLHNNLVGDSGNNTATFLKENGNDPYIQDCSVFPNHSRCCIEEFESGGQGTIKSYIRSCCDGLTWSFDPNKVEKLKLIADNNDSRCAYEQISQTTICVRMCIGNLCNGPTANANSNHPSIIFIMLIKFIWTFYYLFC